MVPVGPTTLGRIINVIGEPIDERGPINTKLSYNLKNLFIVKIFFY